MYDDFPTCFGFTEDEVKAACEEFEVICDFDEVKNWYNGYRFGDKDMYNPWSITGFLDAKEIKNFWGNTGGTGLMDNMIEHGSEQNAPKFCRERIYEGTQKSTLLRYNKILYICQFSAKIA